VSDPGGHDRWDGDGVGPDVRPVIEPEPHPDEPPVPLIDVAEAIDPVTGLRVHSLQPRTPRTRGGKVYLAVLIVAAGGVALVVGGLWRSGATVIGVAFLLAAIGRIALPDHDAGMLKLRRKAIDVPTLLAIGVALVVLAAIVPPAPAP
jgi:hypothetical protein